MNWIKRQPAALVIGVAWLMFITSFFLPAATLLESNISGWEAFFTPLIYAANGLPALLPYLLTPIINIAMLLMPKFVYRDPRRAAWNGKFLLACAIGALLLPKGFCESLQIGFYVWTLSIAAMAVGCLWYSARHAKPATAENQGRALKHAT